MDALTELSDKGKSAKALFPMSMLTCTDFCDSTIRLVTSPTFIAVAGPRLRLPKTWDRPFLLTAGQDDCHFRLL